MNNKRLSLVCLGAMVGLGIAAGFMWLLADSPADAASAVHYVAPGASCGVATPCYGDVQAAVDAASSGDEVYVAAGTYSGVQAREGSTQTVYISKSITIRGGYSTSDWVNADPENNHSILDAQGQGRVIYAEGGSISVQLHGLRVTGGFVPGIEGGGGICIEQVNYALVHHNWIYSNTAFSGGGAYIHRSNSSTVSENEVYSNTAHSGAGVYFHLTGDPTLSDNYFHHNVADYDGGGVYFGSTYSDSILRDNLFLENAAASGGAGVFIKSVNAPQVDGNQILSNTAGAQGGGLYVYGARDAVITRNSIQHNTGRTNGGGVYLGGGSAGSHHANVSFNEISYNTITNITGGGLFIHNSDDVVLEGNRIHHNTADSDNGGGIYLTSADRVVLRENQIYQNQGASGGGICAWSLVGAVFERNEVHDNTATSGAGMVFSGGSGVELVNNAIWDNQTSASGAGIQASNVDLYLRHSTIARNHNGAGLYLSNGATLNMTNTILVSNTVGIQLGTGTAATLEATLWWANGTDWTNSGTLITGTLNWWDEPGFVDLNAGDTHLAFDSPAQDKGVDAGVEADIDGDSRIFGAPPDLGADEFLCFVRLNGVPYATVQDALDASSSPADVVQVAGTCRGVQTRTVFDYPQVAYITKTLTLRGGYNADFSDWDPGAYTTTLDALGQGRVVYIRGPGDVAPTIEALRLFNGRMDSDLGGGIYAYRAQPVISACQIVSNTASNGGGAAFYLSDDVRIAGTMFWDNQAIGNSGGVHFWDSNGAQLTNSIVAENTIGDNDYGSGLGFHDSSAELIHLTLAGNDGGHGQGLYLASSSMVTATNTILVGHTVGVDATAGTSAVMTATLWGAGSWANTTDWAGSGTILTGTINYWGDPAFMADYRINANSAAINRGVDAGLLVDIDGDERPFDGGFDLGADECAIYSIYLPLVLRN